MSRLDEIKARTKKATASKYWRFAIRLFGNQFGPLSEPAQWYPEGEITMHATHDQATADMEFANNARSDIPWLVEQLDEKDRMLVKVMKTADDGLDKITAWVEKLGMISPEKLRELWGLRMSKRKVDR